VAITRAHVHAHAHTHAHARRYTRMGQDYYVPIQLADTPMPEAAVFGTLLPIAAW
jgi:hypothetical protein